MSWTSIHGVAIIHDTVIHEIEIRPGVFVELGDRIVLTSADNKAEEKYRVIGIAIDETDSKPVLKLRMYRHVRYILQASASCRISKASVEYSVIEVCKYDGASLY